MMKHKIYNRTPKRDFKEQVKRYINENKLTDSLIPYEFLYQVRGSLPYRIEIGTMNNKRFVFEEKKICLRNRHYGYKKQKRLTFNLLLTDGKTSELIKDYETFLNDYYYTNQIVLNPKFNLDKITELFGEKQKIEKIERKQFRFSLTDEEHEYVKEFIKRLKNHLKTQKETIIKPSIYDYREI